jgi:hypothetical protein
MKAHGGDMTGSIVWAATALAAVSFELALLIHFKHVLDAEERQVQAIWH